METREPTTAVRTFQLEYARFRMLAEAEVMGVENPGIEFWLLGLLHLASVSDYRMDIFSTPQVGWEDKLQARSRIRQELASRGIIASRLGSILRTLLSQGAESDPDLVESHLAADDPLRELLDHPTDTIAQAIMRLQLLTVLKSFRDTLEATTEIGAVTEDLPPEKPSLGRQWDAYRIALVESRGRAWGALKLIDDPDLLCDLALHAAYPGIRHESLWKLNGQDSLHGSKMRRLLEGVAAHDTETGVRSFAQRLLHRLPQEPEPKPSKPHNLRHSVLNPNLEALCAWGMLDPDDPDDLDLISYLYHVNNCMRFGNLLPDTYRRRLDQYELRRSLMRREYEIDVLEDYVMNGEDDYLRAFSFCRLTGWAHWEDCDQFSTLDYGCGAVPGYTPEQAARLCDKVKQQLGSYPPDYYPWSPMDPRDVVREGAYMVSEQLRYGRNFYDATSFVGQLAREEAAALGIAEEGPEFWLLGALHFAQYGQEDTQLPYFPFRSKTDAEEEAMRCRQLLDAYGIERARFERLLRGALAQGAESDPALLPSLFDTAERVRDWHWNPVKPVDLMKAALRQPTDTTRLALMRLGLLMTLERCWPGLQRGLSYRPDMFRDQFRLKEIDLTQVDISGTTDLSYMFQRCRSLTAIDLSPLDTAHITNMSRMFWDCEALTSIDLSPLDTSRVTDLSGFLYSCESLRSVDLSPLDTSRVTTMESLLQGCERLEEVCLDGLDTSQVTTMEGMFRFCHALCRVDLSGLDTSCVQDMTGMFSKCYRLEEFPDLSRNDTSQVEDMTFMFANCTSLRSVDLTRVDLRSAKKMWGMFEGCTSLERADLSGIYAPQLERIDDLFKDCTALVEVSFEGFHAPRLDNVAKLFKGCSSLKSVDLSCLDILDADKPLFASEAFEDCTALERFSIPAAWPLKYESYGATLPNPTAPCGKWWSCAEGRWMSPGEICERGPMADTFTSTPQEAS